MKKLICIVFLMMNVSLFAQQHRLSLIGGGITGNRDGFIPGISFEHAWKPRASFKVRMGLNVADRSSLKEHTREWGQGMGVGAGLRHYYTSVSRGFFLGITADVYLIRMYWKDNLPYRSDFSNITLLSPAGEIGYRFQLDDRWKLDALVAPGADINVATEGFPVGQGFRLQYGLQLQYRLQ